MRDIAVFVVVLGLLPFILKRPQLGIYTWSWLSYMNPHRMTWSFAYDFPFAQLVAICTLFSILAWKQPKRLPATPLTTIWLVFLFWMLVTTLFAIYPERAIWKLELVVKIQLVTFLTIVVIRTKREIDILIWVITMSLGFFSIKGGIFTLTTLGGFKVWGPPESFIADNNHFAVATLMVVPLMYYLRTQSTSFLLKQALLVAMVLSVVSAFGSQSRGAFLAVMAMGGYFWLKSPGKIVSGIAVLTLFVLILGFMPQPWWDKMYTILDYQNNASAMSRIVTWQMASNVALDRIFGGGFNFWGAEMFRMYHPDPATWHKNTAAHSIYFSIIGEHGWIGFILFVSTFLVGWRTATRVERATKHIGDLNWLHTLMKYLKVSLIAYGAGGAFLNLAYFDLPWHILSLIVIGTIVLAKHPETAGDRTGGRAIATRPRTQARGRRKLPSIVDPAMSRSKNGSST